MTGLRTILGISKKKVTNVFGTHFSDYLEKQADKYLITNKLYWDGDLLKITKKAKFLSDGIASDLFMLKA
jgi:oxygen-independent coproporphyrinogen-3 oxidase